jgi:hypothetical protein
VFDCNAKLTESVAVETRTGCHSGRLREYECDVLETIRQGLTLLGYEVLRVGQWRTDHAGSDPGCPDLLVSHPAWPDACWLGLECKGTETRLSAAQRRLFAAHRIVIARCFEDAWEAVKRLEAGMAFR